MKQLISILCLTLYSLTIYSQQTESIVSIIPEPVSVVKKTGDFVLGKKVVVLAPANKELDRTIAFLKQKLSTATGSEVNVKASKSGLKSIRLVLNDKVNPILGEEGYTLSVTPQKVVIKANKPAGLFYGAQSFIQLFPPEIESKDLVKNVSWKVPAVEITDYPRMGWRGLMLDVARHFFTVDEVKQYIDVMARYKYNMLHLHLTDDEGWRIEIESLPRLTEVGAWRVEKIGNFGQFSAPLPDEPKNYGGFYTHQDIKDLVQYAGERFVNIMPEIDVPGHCLAAIVSYPELSCTEGADKYGIRAGEPITDRSQGAVPVGMVDNTLCPANEKVYDFLDKVMTEVAELFPYPYIHIGGDEVFHNYWAKSTEIPELMHREGLTTFPQVQAYMNKRLEKIIQSKGKKMMGWAEILEGGIAQTTALMSWRSTNSGIEASKSGHEVVMSPNDYTYIDQMQGDASTEPPVYKTLRLKKTYQFNPLPEGADVKYVLGGQANLWTEQVYNIRQAEYMTWPRGFAVAEAVWSPKENKNWKNFIRKTEDHFKRLDYADIKYSPAMYDPIVNVTKKADKYYVDLSTEIDGLDIYTSFDNSSPDCFYPKYKEPLLIPKDASLMRIITYKGKRPMGRLMTIRVEDLKKRVK
ncbi:MAG: family 20 glycosylhydrolase [Bacteroidales bacterium]|nr:family 20 glycosylhydrolase [Bacteroidales bacterium]